MSEETTETTETTTAAETTETTAQDTSTTDGAIGTGEGAEGTASGDGAGEGESGAIGDGSAEEKAAETAAVDYEKMTDDEYMSKVTIPEGNDWNKDVMKEFAPLLRENKIPPEVFAKFVQKDIELVKGQIEKQNEELKKQQEEAQAAFKQAGEDFRKEFTPEQVKEMNETMATLKDDKTFVNLVARSPLSNNKTMGKMLLAYRQVYGEDAVVKGGAADDAKKGFAEVWTGKKA